MCSSVAFLGLAAAAAGCDWSRRALAVTRLGSVGISICAGIQTSHWLATIYAIIISTSHPRPFCLYKNNICCCLERHTKMSFFPSSSPDRERVEPLTTAPDASKFVSLEEHQSSTPSSFYDAPPVLYHHAANCKLLISRRELANTPHMKELWSSSATDKLHSAECDGSHDADVDVVLDGVDVWVTSKYDLAFPLILPGASLWLALIPHVY